MKVNLKQNLFTLIIIIILIICVGCKDEENKEADNNLTEAITLTTVSENNENKNDKDVKNKNKHQEFEELKGTLYETKSYLSYQIDTPMRSFASEMLGDAQTVTGKDVYVFIDKFVSGTSDTKYEVKLEDIKDASQILSVMEKQFINSAPKRLGIGSYTEEYTITKEELLEINGWDMCRYEGYFDSTLSYVKDNKYHFVLYTILKGEYPVYFIVVDNSDGQEQWDYIVDIADKMAQTFREYEK